MRLSLRSLRRCRDATRAGTMPLPSHGARPPRRRARAVATLALCLLAAACGTPATDTGDGGTAAPATPALAVRRLTAHLRDGDLAAFARDAVPPSLHAQLDAAWRSGGTRWPLDELPLSAKLPQALATLAAPGSEAALQRSFDRQFAGASGELRSTANTLGLFAVQYVRNEGDFSVDERMHYAQLVTALSGWAQAAPLSDKRKARATIAALAAAARNTQLASDADFARRGMDDSLRRLRPFLSTAKRVLAGYGLDIDAGLASMDASLQSQTGDTARVRLRYRIGDSTIDTVVAVERRDGRWYVSDHLRHAEAAIARAARGAVDATPAPATPTALAPPPPAAVAPADDAGAARTSAVRSAAKAAARPARAPVRPQ